MPARPSASITVAAILAIAGSALALISIFFAALGMAMMRSAASVPALPPAVQAVTTVSLLLFAGLAVFGIFTGVGLLRLKNWARISILVFSGLATAVSSLTIIFATFLPIPAAPEAGPAMGAFIKVFIMIFYGIPLGIGIWWVILFTRKKISDQFQPQAPGSSGDPNAPLAMPAGTATALPPPVAPSTPACPLPIMVVGGLWILSSLSLVFVLYARTPMVLFGHPFNRSLSVTLWVLKSILYVVAGVGLFRVKPWSLSLSLALQTFGSLSGIVTMSSPRYESALLEQLTNRPFVPLASITPEYVHQLRLFGLAWTLAGLIVIALLLVYRSRFLAAAAAKVAPVPVFSAS